MQKNEQCSNSSQNQILTFLDERIESCETKRRRNLFFMNGLKFVKVVSGVLAVLFVALLAAEGFEQDIKFLLNLSAIVCTSLTALGSALAREFGFENRFSQNVRTAGQLRSMKSRFELEITLLEPNGSLDYREWHKSISDILDGQSAKFHADFERALKSK